MIKTKSFFLFAFVIAAYFLFPEYAFSQSGQVFAAVKKGDNWGYIDTTGKLQIPFTLDKASSFSEGLAAVKYGKQWGYIDKKGTLILKPFLNSAHPFHDGRALISYFDHVDSTEYHGYTNKKGYIVTLLANYETGGDYNDGFVRIRSKSNGGLQFGYKDTLDSFVIKPLFDDAEDFYEGKAAIKTGDKWGFINQKPNMIVTPVYDDAYHFQEGLAYVSEGNKTSFINSKGDKIFTVDYEEVDVLLQDGMICFRDHGKIGFMDNKGKIVIKPTFSGKTLTRFKNGLAPIEGDNGKYGYIDKQGNFVIQPQFDDAQFFYNNYAAVKQAGKYGFINKKGKWIIQPEYDDASEFESADFY